MILEHVWTNILQLALCLLGIISLSVALAVLAYRCICNQSSSLPPIISGSSPGRSTVHIYENVVDWRERDDEIALDASARSSNGFLTDLRKSFAPSSESQSLRALGLEPHPSDIEEGKDEIEMHFKSSEATHFSTSPPLSPSSTLSSLSSLFEDDYEIITEMSRGSIVIGQTRCKTTVKKAIVKTGAQRGMEVVVKEIDRPTASISSSSIPPSSDSRNQSKRQIYSRQFLASDPTIRMIGLQVSILRELAGHSGVVRLLDAFQSPQKCFLVYELAEGGDLFDLLSDRGGYFSEVEARSVAAQLLGTIGHMHSLGIVHRGISPENVLCMSVSNSGSGGSNGVRVKLGGFGLATRLSLLTDDEAFCGIPGYVAPEIVSSRPYGQEVDVWSLGVLCFILLAGYPPFQGSEDGSTTTNMMDPDTTSMFEEIRLGRYVFLEEYWGSVSWDAKDFVSKMLVVDQRERWTAAQLLEHPWISMF